MGLAWGLGVLAVELVGWGLLLDLLGTDARDGRTGCLRRKMLFSPLECYAFSCSIKVIARCARAQSPGKQILRLMQRKDPPQRYQFHNAAAMQESTSSLMNEQVRRHSKCIAATRHAVLQKLKIPS